MHTQKMHVETSKQTIKHGYVNDLIMHPSSRRLWWGPEQNCSKHHCVHAKRESATHKTAMEIATIHTKMASHVKEAAASILSCSMVDLLLIYFPSTFWLSSSCTLHLFSGRHSVISYTFLFLPSLFCPPIKNLHKSRIWFLMTKTCWSILQHGW